MRKKSTSSVEIGKPCILRVNSRKLHPLISPTNIDDKHFTFNDSLNASKSKPNISLCSKDVLNLRGHKGKCSLNLKSNEKLSLDEDRITINTSLLDNLEECRKTFDKIIEKDKKYGPVLKNIKAVYEKTLESQFKHSIKNDSAVQSKVSKEVYGNVKKNILKKTLIKSRSNLGLINNQKLQFPLKNFPQRDSITTFETQVTSPRNNIPELSLFAIPKTDFHEEFMSNYDNFSESWRKLAKDMNK